MVSCSSNGIVNHIVPSGFYIDLILVHVNHVCLSLDTPIPNYTLMIIILVLFTKNSETYLKIGFDEKYPPAISFCHLL